MKKGYLIKKIKNTPLSSGVYFFLDKNGKPLYIGKALNLMSRLKSYLDSNNQRISKMLSLAIDIDYKKTYSEIEALILESQLIKKLKPIFNIKMRDDKQYFYVGITRSTSSGQAREKFPKIFLTHQPQKHEFQYRHIDISSFIGPFTDGVALKTTLRLLRRIFPYCTCKQRHNNFCLNYHIGKCLGVCCLKQQSHNFKFSVLNFKKTHNNYKKNIKAIKDILTGKKTTLIKKLKKEMVAHGNKGNLEESIKLQKQIKKLEKVFENAKILRHFDDSKYFESSKWRGNIIKEIKKKFKFLK